MNGPTRSKAFEKRVPVSRSRPARGADAWSDELDQFIDSEPLEWTKGKRARQPAAHGDGAAAVPSARVHVGGPSTAAAGVPLWDDADETRPQHPQKTRRDAFSQRLDEELARPRSERDVEGDTGDPEPQSVAPSAPAVDPIQEPERAPERAPSDETPAPPKAPWREALDRAGTGAAKRQSPPSGRSRESTVILPPRAPTLGVSENGRAAPAPTPPIAPTPVRAPAPAQSAASTQAAPPAAPSAPAAKFPEPQADPLEQALDDAIGAIIQGRPLPPEDDIVPSIAAATLTEETPRDPAHGELDFGEIRAEPDIGIGGAPSADEQAMPAAEGKDEKAAASAAISPGVVGGKRAKQIPTFKFKRRDEPEPEPFPPVPADVDDPLSAVYFPQAEDEPEGTSEGGRASPVVSELHGDDELFEPSRGHRGEADDDSELLPASLRRARRGRGRSSSRSAGITVAVVGAGVLALVAVVGVNVFAGSGTPVGEPPIIRADAANVKVRAEPSALSAEPDIGERTQVGDSGTLVVPDNVRIGGARSATPVLEEGIVSRPVRTVVVRPDGTLLPSDADVRAPVRREPLPIPEAPTETAPDVAPPAVQELDFSPAHAEDDRVEPNDAPEQQVAALDPPIQDTPEPPAFAPEEPTLEVEPNDAPPAAGVIAVPRPRPTPPPRREVAAAPSQPAVSPPQASAPAAVNVPAAPNAPWAVQVASQRTREEAQQSYRDLQQRYGSILGGLEPVVVAANVSGRGRFYRVRVPVATQREAAQLCQRLKAAGGDCFIGRN